MKARTNGPLSGKERRERIQLLKDAAARFDETGERTGYGGIAKRAGCHTSTLAVWAARHCPDLAKKISRGKGRPANSDNLVNTRRPALREMLNRDPPLGIGKAASELGITAHALRAWMKVRAQDLLEEFAANPKAGVARCLPPERALERAKIVRDMRAEGFKYTQIAKRLNISGAALSFWLTRNAPHGLDELIDMLDDLVNLE